MFLHSTPPSFFCLYVDSSFVAPPDPSQTCLHFDVFCDFFSLCENREYLLTSADGPFRSQYRSLEVIFLILLQFVVSSFCVIPPPVRPRCRSWIFFFLPSVLNVPIPLITESSPYSLGWSPAQLLTSSFWVSP